MSKSYKQVILMITFDEKRGPDGDHQMDYVSRDGSWDPVVSIAPRPSDGFGPAYELEDDHVREGNTIFPVTLCPVLKCMDDKAREQTVKNWRLGVLREPGVLFNSTMPAAHAAKLLGISSVALTSNWINEYRVRWVKLPHGYHPFRGKRVAFRVKLKDVVLINNADVLWIASQRLKKAAALCCPDCDKKYQPGTACPNCGNAKLRGC